MMVLIRGLHNNKYLVLVFIATTLLFTSCNNIERDCKLHRSGKFITHSVVNDSTYTSVFSRNNSVQIEIFNGKIDSSYSRWINDCEFILRSINPKSRIQKKNIHIKILTTTDSSYTYEYSFVGEKRKETGIAIKINN